MEQALIAPCGMNCTLCVSYHVLQLGLKEKGFQKSYCPGCLPRAKNCVFLKDRCSLLGDGLVRFCFECADFPCKRLKDLDKRYRKKYHMSMVENLTKIQANGIERFLEEEEVKWRCPTCGGVICCHVGLCLTCDLEVLARNKKYRWNET